MLLTILEEKAGLSWLRTGRQDVWLPTALLALLSAAGAPFLLELSLPKKIAAALGSLLGFFVIYGLVVIAGVAFLNWDD